MTLPSESVPTAEKQRYSEADVHSKLFEPDMQALGFPPRTNSQADGEYFVEQRRLAVHRTKTHVGRGFHDGLYLVGNRPVLMAELKSYSELDTDEKFAKARRQLIKYASSDDFAEPPPFLVLYSGNPDRTMFMRLRDESAPLKDRYEDLGGEIWDWARIRDGRASGAFALEQIDIKALRALLVHHLDAIEHDIRADVEQAVELVERTGTSGGLVSSFGEWLLDRPEQFERMKRLVERKRAEVPSSKPAEQQRQVIDEIVTQAALGYVNKVFFLALCEERNLDGFYRIVREFLPESRSTTSPATAAVFLGMVRRRLRDTSGEWNVVDEESYKQLRRELAPDINDRVITRNSWYELIRVAFDLAEETFPLVYREDVLDVFRPAKETLAEFVYDLSTKSFGKLSNRHVGDLYQYLLASRQEQRRTLGAYYTPAEDVAYMVAKLELSPESTVLDPCTGSGHFLEHVIEQLVEQHVARGIDPGVAFREVVERQAFASDIDPFAAALAAIRVFLLSPTGSPVKPNIAVHDTLLHTPTKTAAFTTVEQTAVIDPTEQRLSLDEFEFDAVIGNPPYGARLPEFKKQTYARMYGSREKDRTAGSLGTGDGDTYAMFFANAIERVRDGGRISFITPDSFRTLTSFEPLRRRILDTCKVVELLLVTTSHFRGVNYKYADMAITTLERCDDPAARAEHRIRAIDVLDGPDQFYAPPVGAVFEYEQQHWAKLRGVPFFVGVPDEIVRAAETSTLTVGDVADGKQGLATADDKRFLAGIDEPFSTLPATIPAADIAVGLTADERVNGIGERRETWVPFAKGEGAGDWWRPPQVALDWSEESVRELRRRDAMPAGTPRKPRLQNEPFYFRSGISYSVVSSNALSARLLPEGWVFGHKGSSLFVTDARVDERVLLAWLNSALATYLLKRIFNSTATADIGYLLNLPFRIPDEKTSASIIGEVNAIIARLQHDPSLDPAADTEIRAAKRRIDELFLDVFDIHRHRALVLDFDDARRYASTDTPAAS